jgi:hypothetical protein
MRMPPTRRYRYVGPPELREGTRPAVDAVTVTSQETLAGWLASRSASEIAEPFTFVVTPDGHLRPAPRRSEHVDCAAGQDVLAAGEISFPRHGQTWTVGDVSNQSTGYCPDPDSWPAVAEALDRVGLAHPPDFTHKVIFPSCPACHERNIVHDAHFVCAICGSPLPEDWNLSPA